MKKIMKNWILLFSAVVLSFLFQSCVSTNMKESPPVYEEEEPAPKGCAGPAGFVQEGMTVTMYRVAEPNPGAHCESEIRACLNGVLTGSYKNVMCNEPQLAPTIDSNPITPTAEPPPAPEGAAAPALESVE